MMRRSSSLADVEFKDLAPDMEREDAMEEVSQCLCLPGSSVKGYAATHMLKYCTSLLAVQRTLQYFVTACVSSV